MDKQLLRSYIVRAGFTNAEVAKQIGISESTMVKRMRTGNFGLVEIKKMIDFLNIENPDEVFLSEK